MILEWQRPENLRHDYVPPLVAEGVLTAATFWGMAVTNSLLRLRDAAEGDVAEARRHLRHALRMRRRWTR